VRATLRPVAPVAPVAPVNPVAPVLPVAPIAPSILPGSPVNRERLFAMFTAYSNHKLEIFMSQWAFADLIKKMNLRNWLVKRYGVPKFMYL
jgi:hypothetical protein